MRPLTLEQIKAIEVPSPAPAKEWNWYLSARQSYWLMLAKGSEQHPDARFLYKMLHFGEPCCCDMKRIVKLAGE